MTTADGRAAIDRQQVGVSTPHLLHHYGHHRWPRRQFPDGSQALEDVFGLPIPFFRPIEVNPFAGAFDPLSNPTTIWGFNGDLGLIAAHGVSDPAQNSDGVARFWNCDVRFMRGVFKDRSGHIQQGSFGFF
jgi:hypothetical protein